MSSLNLVNMTGNTLQEPKREVRARYDRELGMAGTQGASKIRSGRGCTQQNKKVTTGNL